MRTQAPRVRGYAGEATTVAPVGTLRGAPTATGPVVRVATDADDAMTGSEPRVAGRRRHAPIEAGVMASRRGDEADEQAYRHESASARRLVGDVTTAYSAHAPRIASTAADDTIRDLEARGASRGHLPSVDVQWTPAAVAAHDAIVDRGVVDTVRRGVIASEVAGNLDLAPDVAEPEWTPAATVRHRTVATEDAPRTLAAPHAGIESSDVGPVRAVAGQRSDPVMETMHARRARRTEGDVTHQDPVWRAASMVTPSREVNRQRLPLAGSRRLAQAEMGGEDVRLADLRQPAAQSRRPGRTGTRPPVAGDTHATLTWKRVGSNGL